MVIAALATSDIVWILAGAVGYGIVRGLMSFAGRSNRR